MTLGERIIEYRAKNNLTQKEFAEKVGVTNITISRIEAGRECSKINKVKIEKLLEV